MSPDANVSIDSDNNTFNLLKESIEVSTHLMSERVGQILIFTNSNSKH